MHWRTLSGLERLCLRSSANTAVESPEGYALLVLLNVGEVGVGLGKLHAGKDSCGFPAIAKHTRISQHSCFHLYLLPIAVADLVFLK